MVKKIREESRVIKLETVGYDSNVYLLLGNPVAMIDAGTGNYIELMLAEMRKLGLEPEDISLVVNTHCHFDHAGGDHFFFSAGATIAIHESESPALETGDEAITCSAMFGEKMP
ncbi:MAG: MBL fold metallo-hydrolase, partial [Candidatus Hadarchaeales archaeon]